MRKVAIATMAAVWAACLVVDTCAADKIRMLRDQVIKENKLNCRVAMSEVADTTLVREAQKDLGIKGR